MTEMKLNEKKTNIKNAWWYKIFIQNIEIKIMAILIALFVTIVINIK